MCVKGRETQQREILRVRSNEEKGVIADTDAKGHLIERGRQADGNRSTSLQMRRRATRHSHAIVTVTTSRSLSGENEHVAKSTVTVILREWLHTDILYITFRGVEMDFQKRGGGKKDIKQHAGYICKLCEFGHTTVPYGIGAQGHAVGTNQRGKRALRLLQ